MNNKQATHEVHFVGKLTARGGVVLQADGYAALADVLGRAFAQASEGKGKERHAQALPFDQQPMQTIGGLYGVGFMLGQAAKKAQESQRMPRDRAVAELLGAINYLAGAVIHLEAQAPDPAQAANDATAKHAVTQSPHPYSGAASSFAATQVLGANHPKLGEACEYSSTGTCSTDACRGCISA